MYAYFLSYAHTDYERAVSVFERLGQLGNTVWMDDARPNGESRHSSFIGVPAGASHESVIYSALMQSATFLILDSSAWRDSAYCRKELTWARDAGTRIAVLSTPDMPTPDTLGPMTASDQIDELAEAMAIRADIAFAHIRLSDRGRAPTKKFLPALLSSDAQVEDARTILSAPLEPDVPAISSSAISAAEKILADAAGQQRLRRRVVTSLVAVLLTLTVLAVAAGLAATRDAATAEASRRRAQSLSLAAQALTLDGLPAQEMAAAAWDLDQNSESRSALSQVLARDKQLHTISTPIIPRIRQLARTGDGQWIVTTNTALVSLAPDGHEISRVSTPESISTSPLILQNHWALVTTEDSPKSVYDFQTRTNQLKGYDIQGVAALGSGPQGEVWAATESGDIGIFSAESGDFRSMATVSGHPTAIAATDVNVTVLTDTHTIIDLERAGESLTLSWQQDLNSLKAPFSPPDITSSQWADKTASAILDVADEAARPARDRVIWCDSQLHALIGSQATLGPDARHISLSARGDPISAFSTMPSTVSFACQAGGGLVGSGLLTDNLRSTTPSQTIPLGLLSMADPYYAVAVTEVGGFLASITTQGELRMTSELTPTSCRAGASWIAVPVVGGALAQDLVGRVWFITEGEPARQVGVLDKVWSKSASQRDRSVAVSGSTLYDINASGVRQEWEIPSEVTELELSSDGRTAVMISADAIILQKLDLPERKVIPLPQLPNNDHVLSVALDDSLLVIGTGDGSILALDEAGQVIAEWKGAIGTQVAPRPGPIEGVAAIARDGIVRLFDSDLYPVEARSIGALGAYIESSDVGGVITVLAQSRRAFVLDAETLEVQQVDPVPTENPLLKLSLTPDGRALFFFTRFARVDSDNIFVDFIPFLEEHGELPPLKEGEWDYAAEIQMRPLCDDCRPS